MQESAHALFDMAMHDPLAIFGLLLIGAFVVLFTHIQFKMRGIGYKTYPLFARGYDWTLPAEYLKVRRKQGWSPWPAYAMWPCLVLGIVALVAGLFRLFD
ncbi:MAG TPA: hypothetical protein VN822_00485 [Candidatus Acidoferrales bacterium]|nr:hypothetical protein [Candidatus Acidoferrales bacterium]